MLFILKYTVCDGFVPPSELCPPPKFFENSENECTLNCAPPPKKKLIFICILQY